LPNEILISQFFLEVANASSTPSSPEVIVIESSPEANDINEIDEVNDVEPTLYERSELKRWFMSRMPYDLRTRAGRKWKKDFLAAGFEFPIKIGQCIDCFP